MKKEIVHLEQKNILCLTGHKHTSFEEECNQDTAIIGPLVQRYWQEGFAEAIPQRANPGHTFCLYTDYTSDYKGTYSFNIGEETSHNDVPQNARLISIPAGRYAKFTTDPGPMPEVVIKAWQAIWAMEDAGELGGERLYGIDFERYDERAQDPKATVLEIYLDLKD